jgi:hypothetical protein
MLSPKRRRPLEEITNLAAHRSQSMLPPSKRLKQSVVSSDLNREDELLGLSSSSFIQCPLSVRRSDSSIAQSVVDTVNQYLQEGTSLPALFVKAASSDDQLFPKGSTSPMLYFHLEHSAMICVPCSRRVGTGQSFETHFRNVHRLKGQKLLDAIAFSQQVNAVDSSSPLPNGSPVIPHLLLFHGFECLGCGYLTSSPKRRQMHCSQCSIAEDLNHK